MGKALIKGTPTDSIIIQACDFTSNDIYTEYPWKNTIANTASGMIPLQDSVQDYPVSAPNILRPSTATIWRLDCTPPSTRELSIVRHLGVNLYPRSYIAISEVSLEEAIGRFRLDAAVNLPTGIQLELRLTYQISPIKIVDLSQVIWFQDVHAGVAMHGLLYWLYKLTDDARAGESVCDQYGRVVNYTGQLAIFHGAMNKMKMFEDGLFTDSVFPSDPMGTPRDANSLQIYGWP